MKTDDTIIYNRILNRFKNLIEGNTKEIKITSYEMSKLNYFLPHRSVIRDNDGYFIYSQLDGRYNNYADILRKFCKQHNIIQTEDLVNSSYNFRLGDDK